MQISSISTTPSLPQRDLIAHLPEYARPAIDSFQATGHLEGDNVLRQPIPIEKVPEVEAQLTGQLVQLIAADETSADLAPNQPGVVKISEMGLAEASAWFIGDTREGAVALDATGLLTTAAYAEFSPTAATLVQVMDMGGEKKGTVAAHIDRQNPASSYLELKDVPEGMLPF